VRLCGTGPGSCAAFVQVPHADTIPVLCPSRPGLCSTRATGAVHVGTGARIDPYVIGAIPVVPLLLPGRTESNNYKIMEPKSRSLGYCEIHEAPSPSSRSRNRPFPESEK
jgi:hypothetical protein